jgi:hypothetical protein
MQAGPVNRSIDAGEGVRAQVQITPAQVAVNRFAVQLPGLNPTDVERVQLTLGFLDAELGSQPMILQPVDGSSPPVWQGDAPLLSQPGNWQADLLVRRTGRDDLINTQQFHMHIVREMADTAFD